MITIIGDSTDEIGNRIANWYVSKGNKLVHGPFGAMGFLDQKGELKGACIFCNYNGANIDVHIYTPRALTRGNIKACLDYVFNRLKCIRITVIAERSNKTILRLLPRLHFVYETVLKQYHGKDKKNDGVVYRMTPLEASKWIKINA